jgi:hypothetical protein
MEGGRVIKQTEGPYFSPVVLNQKNGKLRFCVDYKKLNNITVDCFQVPRIGDTLHMLARTKCFLNLKMNSCYEQVVLHL